MLAPAGDAKAMLKSCVDPRRTSPEFASMVPLTETDGAISATRLPLPVIDAPASTTIEPSVRAPVKSKPPARVKSAPANPARSAAAMSAVTTINPPTSTVALAPNATPAGLMIQMDPPVPVPPTHARDRQLKMSPSIDDINPDVSRFTVTESLPNKCAKVSVSPSSRLNDVQSINACFDV